MKNEFCRVLTSDRLELQGLFATPEGGAAETSVLHVHGMAGNFYENRFIDHVAGAVTAKGVNFLTINTRGRDYISDFIVEHEDGSTEYRQIGAIHELFEESAMDITAWTDFLRGRGSRKIILQGHSHGALKVTYYAHKVRDPAVGGIILLSPSDDFGCQRERIGDLFDEALQVARTMIAGGSGAELMPAHYFHYPISARSYVDIYQGGSVLSMFNLSGTDADRFDELESVRVPVLAIVGSVEEAFLGSPQDYLSAMEKQLGNAPSFTGHVIQGAPHNYLGFDAVVARHIGEWLAAARASNGGGASRRGGVT
jgi:pimeloyl-ACP methyl ester carboxylesterase